MDLGFPSIFDQYIPKLWVQWQQLTLPRESTTQLARPHTCGRGGTPGMNVNAEVLLLRELRG